MIHYDSIRLARFNDNSLVQVLSSVYECSSVGDTKARKRKLDILITKFMKEYNYSMERVDKLDSFLDLLL